MSFLHVYILSLILASTVFALPVYAADKNIPSGIFLKTFSKTSLETFSKNSECVSCHENSALQVVTAWRASAHAAPGAGGKAAADCIACHGKEHQGSVEKARKNSACISCHGGRKSSIVNSYTTSKHGVITTIEGAEWDWSASLAEGLYRAPTCAYCHLHSGDHNVSTKIRPWNPQQIPEDKSPNMAKAQEEVRSICIDCHSPRFVSTYLDTGERMLEIGRMKTREAAAVIADLQKDGLIFLEQAGEDGQISEIKIRQVFKKMQSVHMKNLWYGIAHQSPDYQWWHGHPALDEDLLHIKSISTRLRRLQLLHN